jgi:phosphoglycerol transferase MdoB-like AlkP superfamily enzyme
MKDILAAARSFGARVLPVVIVFLAAQSLTRLGLALYTGADAVGSAPDMARMILVGWWFDLVVLLVWLLPAACYWLLLPKGWHGGRLDLIMTRAGFVYVIFLIGFTAVAEFFFWDEFGARFNFIAVDYLVYTREVIGNIWESYPVAKLVAALLALSAGLTWLLRRQVVVLPTQAGIVSRFAVAGMFASMTLVSLEVTTTKWTRESANVYLNELSANGYYALVYAYFRNEIDFRRFYVTADDARVNVNMRRLLEAPNAHFVKKAADDITRDIVYPGLPSRKNVILVTIESMSAAFMAQFGNTRGLTPNLDRLSNEGVFFTNLLATGTRTVRGLEAVTLSVPPTPGQSILRRTGNNDLFSIGSVLRDHGYSTTFMYGGDSVFDNMNAFYTANGYRLIDRANFKTSEISFSNAWGVSDEDLFARAIREADSEFASGRLFMFHIMTVSNHRPYTYPVGKIAPPSGTSALGSEGVEQTRDAAVKYTDYAIGAFIESARKRPWFKDTLFVFVSDHTASVAGKVEVNPKDYHIPALFYSPGFLEPRRIGRLASQMDIAPSILGALQISYRSRFMGADQIRGEPAPRALISNYEKVALVRDDEVVLLSPRRDAVQYRKGARVEGANVDQGLLFDAISYYQYASRWRERLAGIDSMIKSGPND